MSKARYFDWPGTNYENILQMPESLSSGGSVSLGSDREQGLGHHTISLRASRSQVFENVTVTVTVKRSADRDYTTEHR